MPLRLQYTPINQILYGYWICSGASWWYASGVSTMNNKFLLQLNFLMSFELYSILIWEHSWFSLFQWVRFKVFLTVHPLVFEMQQCLLRISTRHKNVSVWWIPSHVEIRGNERADKVARSFTSSDSTTPKYISAVHYYPLINCLLS